MDKQFLDELMSDLWAMIVKATLGGLLFLAVMTVVMIFVNLTGVTLQSREFFLGLFAGAFGGLCSSYIKTRASALSRLQFFLAIFAVVFVCALIVAFNANELTAGIQAGFIAGVEWGFLMLKIAVYQPKGAGWNFF